MVTFNYQFNQQDILLKVSNWCGLESVFVNGKLVSRKFNFGVNSTHKIKLSNGSLCKLQLLLDGQSDLLSCRVYKHNELMTTLKQGKQHLSSTKRFMELSTLTITIGVFALLLGW
ncbi:hypothetical protein EXU30_19100 [Shewanella maritima]|uniref:Uncharacterized protein n=1 Tax=Shewanella maritima TaxID=2520507 RepID=A0A411PM00_9GAMM|nr:hypothetical protein [Shewanella maritima]QBF84539.1 hypothetical protein EXU30_19100 [Shewanella maritima]